VRLQRVSHEGYWVAHITITDLAAYKQYAALFKPAFKKFGARDIIRGAKASPGYPGGGRFEVKEGSLKDRHVVIEFDTYEQALACYDSPEYQATAKFREQVAQVDLLIIEGCDVPVIH
jgi:uncharacterized protein (DUF1330 family)